jgi:hypothetical protein
MSVINKITGDQFSTTRKSDPSFPRFIINFRKHNDVLALPKAKNRARLSSVTCNNISQTQRRSSSATSQNIEFYYEMDFKISLLEKVEFLACAY